MRWGAEFSLTLNCQSYLSCLGEHRVPIGTPEYHDQFMFLHFSSCFFMFSSFVLVQGDPKNTKNAAKNGTSKTIFFGCWIPKNLV